MITRSSLVALAVHFCRARDRELCVARGGTMRFAQSTDSLTRYKSSLAGVAPLDRQTERDLARKFLKGDRRSGDALVAACLPFVVSIALEYRRWGVPLEDIIQQGNLGLLRAAKKFDPERDVRLATYAAYWIRAEIREYVVRAFRVVRLGTTKAERRALRAFRAGEANVERLAEMSGLSVERTEQLLPMLMGRESSLDARTDDGGSPQDRLASTRPSPEEETQANEEQKRAHAAIGDALVTLSDREKLIIKERMMTDDPPTLQALGDRLGVSKERVRQIEERAKSKLRERLSQAA
jgi:RNA polymerase sigma-32 factor